ncbi:MAG: IS110 family transposase, partial [Actinomycetota bacterium]|nr:IS110 family transposase [Actinomycetota bacterium]
MRSIGMDVHRDFCEVALVEDGALRSAGRVETSPEALGVFADSLCETDEVVLETTSGAIEIARLLAPRVARVVLANAADVRAIAHARVKSDRFDAATLARLLAAGMIDGVWVPDERIGALRRRIARRAALVRQRTRAKNEVHAVIMRCLLGRPPASDLFGVKGRAWLASQQLPPAEEETAAGCLRQIDFLDGEIAIIDAQLAALALESPDARRLMTIPGIDVAAACTLIAAIGDIRRFDSPRKLAAYLGLDPRVRQSGEKPARYGAISKRGNPHARHVLVEAGWQAMRTPGPLRAFGERIRARKGSQVAAVAVARKIATIAWQMLRRDQDYAFHSPSLVRKKLRNAELTSGAPRLPTRHPGAAVRVKPDERQRDRELQEQAERGYRRLVADWQATPRAGAGAGATPGRASTRPTKGKATRQA